MLNHTPKKATAQLYMNPYGTQRSGVGGDRFILFAIGSLRIGKLICATFHYADGWWQGGCTVRLVCPIPYNKLTHL